MTAPNDPQSSLTTLKNLLLGVTSTTAFLVAPLWFLGRQASFGYYEALAIPRSELTWTLWEYGEFGWPALAKAFLLLALSLITWLGMIVSPRSWTMASIMGLVAGIGIGIIAFFIGLKDSWPLVIGITTGILGISRTTYATTQRLPNTLRLPLFDEISILMVALLILLGTADMAFHNAQQQAYKDFRDTPLVADIILNKPLFGSIPVVPLSPTLGLYAYPQVVVVTVNSDQYFVATALTRDCLPQTVRMVKLADVQSIAYQQVSLATLPCGQGNAPLTSTIPLMPTSPLSITVPLSRSP
ncbi:hypothetical protein [Herpetosiphon giganteus]|uniref:hypothetical protein n=1 Tax=Herpetosiphon giganteus TaxID=2029754 RepID=UPI0019598293|nr:hypothetical protein [Herpetosiphon giganteus]MBM7845932.1 hypothetical protein [Herpetosiphon giganteus]